MSISLSHEEEGGGGGGQDKVTFSLLRNFFSCVVSSFVDGLWLLQLHLLRTHCYNSLFPPPSFLSFSYFCLLPSAVFFPFLLFLPPLDELMMLFPTEEVEEWARMGGWWKWAFYRPVFLPLSLCCFCKEVLFCCCSPVMLERKEEENHH